jgi:hypothetical protein
MCDPTAWNPSDRTFMARHAGEYATARQRTRHGTPTKWRGGRLAHPYADHAELDGLIGKL